VLPRAAFAASASAAGNDQEAQAKRGAEPKVKESSYGDEDEPEDALEEDEDLDDIGGDEDDIDLGLSLPKIALDGDMAEEDEPGDDEVDDGEDEPVSAKAAALPKAAPPSRAKRLLRQRL